MKQHGKHNEDLLGLFELVTQPNGEVTAEFTNLTAPYELNLRWKLKGGEEALARSLLMLSTGSIPFPLVPLPEPAGNSNIHAIHQAGEKLQNYKLIVDDIILTPLVETFREDIATLIDTDNPPEARANARKKLQKRFSNVLDAFENKQTRNTHGSASVIECDFEETGSKPMPTAWVTLQITRQLVEKNQTLPTKGSVRLKMASAYPDSSSIAERKWTYIWNDSGLKDLPQATPWELEELKRSAAKRKRTKKS